MPRSYGTTNAAPYATAPAVGLAGDTYFNTTSKTLYLSDGTSWIQVQGGAASITDYYFGRCAAPTISSGGGTITWTSTRTQGFTQINTTDIRCDVAGTYFIAAQLEHSTLISWCYLYINLYRGGTLLTNEQHLGGYNPTAGAWVQLGAQTVFNLAVGDIVTISAQPAQSTPFSSGGALSIIAVGGPKGDTGPQGPDVTLLQSNYWFGAVTATTTPGGDIQTNIGWTSVRINGFTLASSNQRITPTLAGKYEVKAMLSYNVINAANYCRTVINHCNAAGTVLVQVSGVGGAAAANGYAEVVGFGIFDMAVGDYILIAGASSSTAAQIVTNSYCTVTPVGGTKGDTGAAGPSGALALASWYYSNFNNLPSGGVTFNNANSTAQLILPTSPISAQNFTRHTSGGVLVGQTGKYLVEMHVSVYANRGVSLTWMVGIVRVYRGGVTADPDIVTVGPGTSSGWYTAVGHAVQLNLVAGDVVLFYGNPSDTCDLDTRSWLSISPVGGTKGDIGPSGGPVPTGGTTGQIIVKQSATDFAVAWANPPAISPVFIQDGGAISLGGVMASAPGNIDATVVTFTAQKNGWCEVIGGPIYFGYGGSPISNAYASFYTNSLVGPDGGALQAFTNVQGIGAALWQQIYGDLALIFAVTAGNSYVVTFRGHHSQGANCYWGVYGSWKVFAR